MCIVIFAYVKTLFSTLRIWEKVLDGPSKNGIVLFVNCRKQNIGLGPRSNSILWARFSNLSWTQTLGIDCLWRIRVRLKLDMQHEASRREVSADEAVMLADASTMTRIFFHHTTYNVGNDWKDLPKCSMKLINMGKNISDMTWASP